jgi:hypothetical protein
MLFVPTHFAAHLFFKRQKKIKELQANTTNKKTRHKKPPSYINITHIIRSLRNVFFAAGATQKNIPIMWYYIK